MEMIRKSSSVNRALVMKWIRHNDKFSDLRGSLNILTGWNLDPNIDSFTCWNYLHNFFSICWRCFYEKQLLWVDMFAHMEPCFGWLWDTAICLPRFLCVQKFWSQSNHRDNCTTMFEIHQPKRNSSMWVWRHITNLLQIMNLALGTKERHVRCKDPRKKMRKA